MAMKFVRRLGEGERCPAMYGVAWQEWKGYVWVVMPVPFNILARVLRDLWLYLGNPGPMHTNPREAYRAGYKSGRKAAASARSASCE